MKGSKYMVAALLLVLIGGSLVFADITPQATAIRSDDEIVTDIVAKFRGKIGRNYAFNTVFVSSENGNVLLTGQVRDAYIKDRANDAVTGVPGVQSVINRIEILPVSTFDDRLRIAIYRRLSNDGMLFHYFVGKDPSINIIVDGSKVTLVGVVNSQVDKVRAASRIRGIFGVLGVDNQLIVTRG
jgi:osmotically-inducible protein OsmY